MAPAADTLSPAGSSTYSSDTLNVGDGTWDFSKNTYLLPPLMGVNFDTMRANGMAQRFSTIPQYHKLVLAHGVIATIVFLFIVPIAVFVARFYRGPPASYRYHAYMQVVAVLLSTVAFVLGYFAVGPNRSLDNPHHGIGVAIYTLILVQAIGGRLIKNTRGRSLKTMLHRWFGRAITILGVVQVPLGLTLYGSPKYLFILYACWMGFLLLVYFIYSYKRDGYGGDHYSHGGRSDYRSEVTKSSSPDGGHNLLKWAAGGAALAAILGRRGRNKSRSNSVSSRTSRSNSRRRPEVIPSRRGSGYESDSYVTNEKYSGRPEKKQGFFSKMLGMGAAAGGAAMLANMMGGKKKNRADSYRDEYSTVLSDTPPRKSHSNHRPMRSEISDETEDSYDNHGGRRTPLLPPPVTHANNRPTTPRPSHRPRPGQSAISGVEESDYSSYISASPSKNKRHSSASAGKGLLAGLGLGWIAGKMKGKKEPKDYREEPAYRYEDERRTGNHGSKYTGDGYSSPSRRASKRYSTGRPSLPPPSGRATSMTYDSSDVSSALEPRPFGSSHAGPPMPPLTASSGPPGPSTLAASTLPPTITPIPAGPPVRPGRNGRSRNDVKTVEMPAMPEDPGGIFAPPPPAGADSGSEDYHSPGGHTHRKASKRRREDSAAAAALASASRLAAEEEEDRRRQVASTAGLSVSVKMHSDPHRTVTLRQLTEEERERSRRDARRRQRNDSVSSLSGTDSAAESGSGANSRRYRREQRKSEQVSTVESGVSLDSELAPPAPPFAGRRKGKKDSAYYSGGGGGDAGPSRPPPAGGGLGGGPGTVSSVDSPESYWSPSTSNAAAKRKQRRADRRGQPPANTVDFQ